MQIELQKRSYELNFQKLPGYLFASIHCPVASRDVVGSYMREIIDKCKVERAAKLMIEIDTEDSSWIWEAAFIDAQFPSSGLSKTKVAIVDHTPERTDLESFGVSFGSGLRMDIRVFRERAKATDWLSSDYASGRGHRPGPVSN
jgi:hypothetical protein